jgi:hypothetical protein
VKATLTFNVSGSKPGDMVLTHLNGQVVVGLGTDYHNLVNLVSSIDALIVDVDRIRGELLDIHKALSETVLKFVPLETVDEPQSVS